MTLVQFREYLHSTLEGIYTKDEIRIIYNILIKRYCGYHSLFALLYPDQTIHPLHLFFLQEAVEKLTKNMPLEYVTSNVEFCGYNFWVNPAVLIPRPETEELVEHAIRFFKGRKQPHYIIDLGTGSGCIAIALKKHFTNADVVATDISPSALKTASYNANLHKVDIKFYIHNMLKDEHLPVPGDVDLLVSNPPYVLKHEMSKMQKRVLDFEPVNALFAPQGDPMIYYSALLDFILRYLSPGGYFILEINNLLAESILELYSLQKEYLINVEIINDLFGKNRFISGVKAEF